MRVSVKGVRGQSPRIRYWLRGRATAVFCWAGGRRRERAKGRSTANGWLDRGEHGPSNGLREFDWRKELRRKQVVFAGLIDDANLAVLGRIRIRQGGVDLSPLEGYLVAVVTQAQHQSSTMSCHKVLIQVAFDLQFLPAHTRCLIPMDFGVSDRSIGESDSRPALPLAPPPLAVSLAKASSFSDSPSNRERLDVRDLSDDGEIHAQSSPRSRDASIAQSKPRLSRGRRTHTFRLLFIGSHATASIRLATHV